MKLSFFKHTNSYHAALIELVVFSACLFFYNSVVKAQNCSVLQYVNGCTTPLWLPVPYKSLFTPACNIHDVCYRCGEKYNWKQNECDRSFKRKMYGLCKSSSTSIFPNQFSFLSSWENIKEFHARIHNAWKELTTIKLDSEAKRIWKDCLDIFFMIIEWKSTTNSMLKCQQGADIYYAAVNTFGNYAFRKQSPKDCNLQCAKQLGTPT